jgi:deoxyadenosine/deoxycytidine kinase
MPKIISLEGNIGSGKSTLINLLKEHYIVNKDIIFLHEPVEEWNSIKDHNNINILTKFYENQKKYSFAFQIMAYISRLNLLKNTIKKYPKCIIITERSLNTDRYVFAKMLYDSGFLEDVEYQIYLKWFESFIEFNIDKTIYIKTTPNICYERISIRNRTGENKINIEYLNKCHQYHETMIENINHPILKINGNDNVYENINEWINIINNFI